MTKYKQLKNYRIADKYGYIVADVADIDDATHLSHKDDFMAGHSYVVDTTGSNYYFCNGYRRCQSDDVAKDNCQTAQRHGIDHCQCGKCQTTKD